MAKVGGGNNYGTEFRYRTILVGELVGIVAGWRSGYRTILVGELVGIVASGGRSGYRTILVDVLVGIVVGVRYERE